METIKILSGRLDENLEKDAVSVVLRDLKKNRFEVTGTLEKVSFFSTIYVRESLGVVSPIIIAKLDIISTRGEKIHKTVYYELSGNNGSQTLTGKILMLI
jgi:hypothetical protein